MLKIVNAIVRQDGMGLLVNDLAIILTKNVVLKPRGFRLIFVQYMEVDRFPKFLSYPRVSKSRTSGQTLRESRGLPDDPKRHHLVKPCSIGP